MYSTIVVVLNPGPPPVITAKISKTFNDPASESITITAVIGRMAGMVISRNLFQALAPSRSAAS